MNTSSKIPGLFRRLTYKIPIFRSLKAYIFLLMLIIGIVPSDIMRLGILNNYEERAVNLRGSDVASQYRIIANHLVNYNYLQNPTSDVVNAELEQMSNLYDGRVLIINSNFRIVKDTYAMSEGKTMVIFNALIIVFLIPLALKGVSYRPLSASAMLRRNLWVYGLGGLLRVG